MSKNTSGLEQCPFCSGKYVDYNSLQISSKGKTIFAKCPDCGANYRVLEHIYNTRPKETAFEILMAPMLCGHLGRYYYPPNGDKKGYCILCELKRMGVREL